MIRRNVWIDKIGSVWAGRSVLWLSGVRRVGKTTLSGQLEGGQYLNCDLPSVRRLLADPELFFRTCRDPVVVFDEIHRLEDPSLLLKIAADEFKHIQVLATGSSTLEATKKFRDSLTDRKRSVHLSPVLWQETTKDFGIQDLNHRCLRGGLPGNLLAENLESVYFEDWIDSFYARDIQELFNVRNRSGFLKLFHLIGLQSGGQLDITAMAKKSALARPTVMSYLDAMEIAHAVHRVPPYFGGGHREIIKQPKAYLFDTGFVAHISGWDSIRPSDAGLLWEHMVLDELKNVFPTRSIHYWRDKSQREVDFVIESNPRCVDVYEAKLNIDSFDPSHIQTFRSIYPDGKNYVISPYVEEPYPMRFGSLEVVCVSKPIL
jgi:predicted AAA+ superfamily ATPase